jgi:hypothetical protein
MLFAVSAGTISATMVGVAGIVGGIVIAWMSNRTQIVQRAADRAHEQRASFKRLPDFSQSIRSRAYPSE